MKNEPTRKFRQLFTAFLSATTAVFFSATPSLAFGFGSPSCMVGRPLVHAKLANGKTVQSLQCIILFLVAGNQINNAKVQQIPQPESTAARQTSKPENANNNNLSSNHIAGTVTPPADSSSSVSIGPTIRPTAAPSVTTPKVIAQRANAPQSR